MKKKILSLLLAFVLLLSVLPLVSAETLSGTCGEKLAWTLDTETGVLTITGSGAMSDYSRYDPDQFAPWGVPNSIIKRVELPKGLTEIGENAFWRCDALESVNFPKGLKRIGMGAFEGTALQSVELPDGVEIIGMQAFQSCEKLAAVSLPGTLRDIGTNAFEGTAIYQAQLTEKSSDVYIGNYLISASQPASGSEETPITYRVKDGTVGIAAGAFNVFGNIESVYVPSSVRMLSARAFDDDYIKNVYIAEGIEEIGSYVFFGNGLQHIELPASVKKIDTYAFAAGAGKDSKMRIINQVCFLGAAPELEAGALLYESGSKAVSGVYFLAGQPGWDYPSWNDVAARWWNGKEVVQMLFADVAFNSWYMRAVDFAVGTGLMNGVSESRFDPNGSMTRAMLVTVLWRYEGEKKEGASTFTDVPAGQWYTDAVAWAAANGIVGGIGDNKFDPNGNITREQMAAILFRYADKKGIDTAKRGDLSKFPDASKVSAYANDPIAWAVAEEIIGGSDGQLLPQGNATRAQVATILMRFIEGIAKK